MTPRKAPKITHPDGTPARPDTLDPHHVYPIVIRQSLRDRARDYTRTIDYPNFTLDDLITELLTDHLNQVDPQ